MQKLYCVLAVFVIIFGSTARAVPLRYRRAFSYIANETACTVDHIVYKDGDPIPTDDPCESCKCRPPGFSCVLRECEVKTGCKAIRRAGECCPQYQCGCEHNGNYYGDGDRIPNAESPCYSCYCQGSSITCSLADCKFRFDCEPEYVLGECCPRYDHCPPENIPTSVTVKSTAIPLLTTLFTKSTTSQSVTTTPMPITSTPLTTSPSPYTTTSSTTESPTSTKPSTTSTTPSTIITTPYITTLTPLITTTTPPPITTTTTPLTTPAVTTIITELPSTSPPQITIESLPITTPSSTPSSTISPTTKVYSTNPSIVKDEMTTIRTSELETLVPSESITESSTKSPQILPELTFPTTTDLAPISSTEYSKTEVIKESLETKATTLYSTNAQTFAPNIETTTPGLETSSKTTETSGSLFDPMITTIKSEITTQSPESGDKEVVTSSVSLELTTQVKVETTSKELIKEPQMTTSIPEMATNASPMTTQLNFETQTTKDIISVINETITGPEVTTPKAINEETTPLEEITTNSVDNSQVITTKATQVTNNEITTQINIVEESPPKSQTIESIESTKESVSEGSAETTTLGSDLEVTKTDEITTISQLLKSEEPKTQPNYEVITTEKPTEKMQTIAFTQPIILETTTSFANVYETTLKTKVTNEENPIESDISSDAMIDVPKFDPTIVKSDQISTSSSEATTPQIPKETAINNEEMVTKESTITTSYETGVSGENLATTNKMSGLNPQSLNTETTKLEEFTTRMSEEKIEILIPEESNSGVVSEETTTQRMTTLKIVVDLNDEITKISVSDTNVNPNSSQNMTTQSPLDNNETTFASVVTQKSSPDITYESTSKANQESNSETTILNVSSDQMTTDSGKNDNSIVSETTISSKKLENNSESVTTTVAESESVVTTIPSSDIS